MKIIKVATQANVRNINEDPQHPKAFCLPLRNNPDRNAHTQLAHTTISLLSVTLTDILLSVTLTDILLSVTLTDINYSRDARHGEVGAPQGVEHVNSAGNARLRRDSGQQDPKLLIDDRHVHLVGVGRVQRWGRDDVDLGVGGQSLERRDHRKEVGGVVVAGGLAKINPMGEREQVRLHRHPDYHIYAYLAACGTPIGFLRVMKPCFF